jgi:anaerobic magnesium-protoporphyrin IX monomethyl ester cyclase
MKCALLIPPWSHMDTHLDALVNTVAGVWAPTGILYIAAVLRQDGHEVMVLDGAMMTEIQMCEMLVHFNPQFIGICSPYPLWKKTKNLAIHLRIQHPHSFIAVGSQGPTYLKERCFEECEAIDAVVVGEGEEIVRMMVNQLEHNGESIGIAGTIVKHNGVVCSNPGVGIVQDLDSLPMPAYDLINIRRYRPSIGLFRRLPIFSTFSSRGCPNQCIYCSKLTGPGIRCKSPQKIGEELQYYVSEMGAKEVKFFDDLFTYDKERAMLICEEILRRKLPLIWSASSRIDTIDRELLKTMKRAGCWYVHYGVESGVQKNLDMLKKGTRIEQIREVINLTHEVGLHTFTSYILGIPGETQEEAKKTISFACELNSLFSEFFNCTPFPGTELYENVEKYGVMTEEVDKVGMHLNSFYPFTLTEAELKELRREAFLKFYFRWGNINKQLRSIHGVQDVVYKLMGLKAMYFLVRG